MKKPSHIANPPRIIPDALYTDEDVCQLLGFSLDTLRRRVLEGRLACHEDGHWRRFTGQQLLAYLARCQRPADPPVNPLRLVDAVGTTGCKVTTV